MELLTILLPIVVLIVVYIMYYYDVNHLNMVSSEYDKLLNNLMDKEINTEYNHHTLTFENTDLCVWVGNYPYAFGYNFKNMDYPTMETRKRLKHYMSKKYYEKYNKI